MKWADAARAGHEPTVDDAVAELGDGWPLLRALRDTPQDPEWHAEGDVHVHTGWVLDALWADLRARPVPPDERVVLGLAALLHDIAKPLVTRTSDDGRVIAPHHEALGRSWLVPRLVGAGLPWPVVDAVVELVGAHHLPKGLVRKARPASDWRRATWAVAPDLLTRLELADMRGRSCRDQAEQVETVELFGLGAEDHVGWVDTWRAAVPADRLLPSAADWARGEALRGAVSGRFAVPDAAAWLAHAVPAPLPELVVLVGPSGSGKSTYCARHLGDHERVSLDALRAAHTGDALDQSENGRVRQAAREQLKAALRAKRKVVWDATSLRREQRAPVLQLGFDYGALVTVVAFGLGPDELARRNRSRTTAVPDAVLAKQLAGWEWPGRDEAHRRLVVGADGVLAADGFTSGP